MLSIDDVQKLHENNSVYQTQNANYSRVGSRHTVPWTLHLVSLVSIVYFLVKRTSNVLYCELTYQSNLSNPVRSKRKIREPVCTTKHFTSHMTVASCPRNVLIFAHQHFLCINSMRTSFIHTAALTV